MAAQILLLLPSGMAPFLADVSKLFPVCRGCVFRKVVQFETVRELTPQKSLLLASLQISNH